MVKTTTRLTHTPKKNSGEMFLQDEWDKMRSKIVPQYRPADCVNATVDATVFIKNVIDLIAESPQTELVAPAYRPFQILDEEHAKLISDFTGRIMEDEALLLRQYAKSKGLTIIATGSRETGCVVFKDGTKVAVNPTTGIQLNGADNGGLHSIVKVTTIYVWFSKGISLPKC